MSGDVLMTTAPSYVYAERRRRLARELRRPLVIFAGHAPPRNYPANTHYFRAQSTFLYFAGVRVEGAILVVEPGSDGDQGSRLYHMPSGPDDEVWFGPQPSVAQIAAAAGLSASQSADRGDFVASMRGRDAGFVPVPCSISRQIAADAALTPASSEELLAIIALRLSKDDYELAAMRAAAVVTIEAHQALIQTVVPGRSEADAVAAFMSVLVRRQHQPSFNPIISVRGEILHCNGYMNRLEKGALLLTDAASEEPGGYASDMTRVYPVGGEFTSMQRAIYDAVERAMQTAVAACIPGRRFRDIHFLAARMLNEGLVSAGLLKGDPATLTERGAHTLFFTHGVGHLIGLDVHDMEDYGDLAGYPAGRQRPTEFGSKFLRLDRDLAPGMCVTIEPGIYFSPGLWRRQEFIGRYRDCVVTDVVDRLLAEKFGGIRLEQTVHVRAAGGPEVLTEAMPVRADEILLLMRG